MYFSVALIVVTTHVDPVQVIPPLLAVTVGAPVVSSTVTPTRVPEQTGIRWAVSLRESGSITLPLMKLTTFGLLDGL